MDDAISAVREVFAAQGAEGFEEQPRRRVQGKGVQLSALFAHHPRAGVIGGKIYVVTREGARFLVLLHDAATGRALALIEADRLGQVRTGAASAVATDLLALAQASSLGMIGAGYQARTQLEAISRVRRLTDVRVHARRREPLEQFCREMSEKLSLAVRPAATASEAVRDAEILVTITQSQDPVLHAADLQPGQHVNAAGSNRIGHRELDAEAVLRCGLVAVDSVATAVLEAGDLRPVLEDGRLREESLVPLGRIAAGKAPGRTSADQITLFCSQGIAALDLAAAHVVYQRALREGRGQDVEFLG